MSFVVNGFALDFPKGQKLRARSYKSTGIIGKQYGVTFLLSERALPGSAAREGGPGCAKHNAGACMAGPIPLPVTGQGNIGANLLEQVELLSFTATPDHVLPFQSSTLRWNVKTPGGVAFSVDFFASRVSATGMKVVQPVVTSEFALQARALQAETTLGTVTVFVDASQCMQQVKADCAFDIGVFVGAGILTAVGKQGYSGTLDHTPQASITSGLISFDGKATISSVGVNLEIKGSFGLIVDRSADQLSPINESSDVNVSASAATWAFVIAVGAGLAAGIGAAIGALGGPFGVGLGSLIGAVAGGIAAAVGVAVLLNNISGRISASMPDAIDSLVKKGIATFFHEPDGMAMATVSVDPDPAFPPDGNITVTFCPKPGGLV